MAQDNAPVAGVYAGMEGKLRVRRTGACEQGLQPWAETRIWNDLARWKLDRSLSLSRSSGARKRNFVALEAFRQVTTMVEPLMSVTWHSLARDFGRIALSAAVQDSW